MIEARQKTNSGTTRRVIAAALAIAPVMLPARAPAQQVVLMVNGDPITDYDIDQRMKFLALSTHKPAVRQEVIEGLIDEKLKVQIGRRYKFELPDTEIEQNYAEMGRRMRLAPDQLTQQLAQAGVDSATLKARIRADLTWQFIIRGRYKSSLEISEKSVQTEIQNRKPDEAVQVGAQVGYDYTLRPILFVVPRGNQQLAEARRHDAEALRSRFTACDTGLPFARSLRDVAIREPIVKNSGELLPALREILDKTEVGHLTAPELTPQGIELFALCEKKETKVDTPERQQAREKIFSEQFQSKANRLLKDLRRQAMIERK